MNYFRERFKCGFTYSHNNNQIVQDSSVETTYRHHEANIHANEGDTKESNHANDEIKLVGFEEMVCFFILYETEHCRHDNGRKCNKRSVTKKRCQKEER